MYLDELGPLLVRELAPRVAAEIRRDPIGYGLDLRAPVAVGPDYDAATCATYVRELGQNVVNRALDFFSILAADGRVGSLDLAQALGTSTPRNIPANLTNALKQRARRLGLELPWTEGVSADNRTVWIDRDRIAERMVVALRDEAQRRIGP